MNKSSIFRTQAIAAIQHSITGDILIRPKFSLFVITTLLICMLSLVITWLLMSQYTLTKTVKGWLEPKGGITHVYSSAPGAVISEIFVEKNQSVQIGTPLFKLTRETVYRNNQSMTAFQEQQIHAQIQRLEAQRQFVLSNHHTRIAQIRSDIEKLIEEQHKIAQLQDVLSKKRALLISQRERVELLETQGFSSLQQLQVVETQILDEQYHLQQLGRESLAIDQAIKSNHTDIESLEHELQIQLLANDNQIGDSQRQLEQLYSTSEIIITAPISGFVSQLNTTLGFATQASVPLLSIMPESTEITARLLIPISAAGQVATGQKINLRYDAFPHTQFGVFAAKIDYVAPHLMLPQELAQTPINVQEPVYLASAIPASSEIHRSLHTFSLRAGMTFSAEIAIRERNLWQWLFEPLIELKGAML